MAVCLIFGQAHGQDIVVTNGSSASNNSPASRLSITVYGTDALGTRSTYSANAALTVANSVSVSSFGVFDANADVSVSGYVSSNSAGTLNLNSGTLSTPSLSLYGASAIAQNGGRYAVGALYLYAVPALTYGPGDAITTDVGVDSAALTLGRNLSISGGLSLTDGGTIVRSGSESITAGYFYVSTSSTLAIAAGDSFAGSNYVSSGGQASNTAATNFSYLSVSGSDSFGNRAIYTANANVSVTGYVSVASAGRLNLNSGTLSALSLSLTGSSALAQSGGHYVVNDLYLFSGATATYGPGDGITANVIVSGTGSRLTQASPLELQSLTLSSSGSLLLTSFTGSWNGLSYAMRLDGNATTQLQGYQDANQLLYSISGSDVAFVFDAGSNATYVIPEPATCALAAVGMGLAGLLLLLRRTRRERRRAECAVAAAI